MVLVQVSKKGNSAHLLFDNNEKIILPYDLYTQIGLYKGDEISNKEKTRLLEKIELYSTKQNAFRFLSGRNHSKNELNLKLLKKGYKKNIISIVLSDLERLGYLNDADFTEQFYKINIKKKGINRIKSDLYKKGVARNIIEEVSLSYIDSPVLFDRALELAEKKLVYLQRKENSKIKIKQKLYQFLLGKGYSGEIITKVISKLNLEQQVYE